MTFAKNSFSSIRRRLLAWFGKNRRNLPWRADRDPYRIWISEVMLQQTTVATVAPRFERFLLRFPTLADLANADEQEVLREWEGLGYYRRARHLHEAARQLMTDHQGVLPNDPSAWASLPGVGRYILGAVLSQAFDQRWPIVEANSRRVLCRLFGQEGDPKDSAVRQWLWATAAELVPRRRAGDFNQALMELGALICTPAAPRCHQCPLATICAAKRAGLQETIPLRAEVAAVSQVREVAVVVQKKHRLLLVRRPEQARWANMWEFPHGVMQASEPCEPAARRMLKSLTNVNAKIHGEITTIRHTVTRFRITLICLEASYRSGVFRSSFYNEDRWVKLGELATFPVSSPQRRLAQTLVEMRQRRLF